jgi:hypothetical protein
MVTAPDPEQDSPPVSSSAAMQRCADTLTDQSQQEETKDNKH